MDGDIFVDEVSVQQLSADAKIFSDPQRKSCRSYEDRLRQQSSRCGGPQGVVDPLLGVLAQLKNMEQLVRDALTAFGVCDESLPENIREVRRQGFPSAPDSGVAVPRSSIRSVGPATLDHCPVAEYANQVLSLTCDRPRRRSSMREARAIVVRSLLRHVAGDVAGDQRDGDMIGVADDIAAIVSSWPSEDLPNHCLRGGDRDERTGDHEDGEVSRDGFASAERQVTITRPWLSLMGAVKERLDAETRRYRETLNALCASSITGSLAFHAKWNGGARGHREPAAFIRKRPRKEHSCSHRRHPVHEEEAPGPLPAACRTLIAAYERVVLQRDTAAAFQYRFTSALSEATVHLGDYLHRCASLHQSENALLERVAEASAEFEAMQELRTQLKVMKKQLSSMLANRLPSGAVSDNSACPIRGETFDGTTELTKS